MYKRTFGFGLCVQLIWLLSVAPSAWGESPLGETWGKFDRYISDFDPLGRAIRDPLQEAIPGLRVVGFFNQWVDWNIDGDTRFLSAPNPETGQRALIFEKDHTYQQLTSLAEVQFRYALNPTLWAVGTLRYEYNGAFDTHNFGRRPRNKQIHWLTHPNWIIREGYLDWFPNPSWRILLGRQQEAWGKLISPITDIIHGFDVREGPQFEGDDFFLRRVNRFMLNLTYYTEALGGTNEFKLLYIPEFLGNQHTVLQGAANSPWNPPNFNPAAIFGIQKKWDRRPDWDISDNEVFARWTWSGLNFTGFLMYGYMWDRTPSVWVHRDVRTSAGGLQPFLHHSRSHGYGGGFDYGYVFSNVPFGIETLPLTVTLESFFASDLEYTDASLGPKVASGEVVDNHVRRTAMRHALQFDFAFPDRWSVASVNVFQYTFNWRKGLSGGFAGPNEWLFIPVLVVAHPWRATEDRLSTTLQIFTQFAGPAQTDQWGGVKLRPIIAYSLSSYIQLRLIGTLFFGHGARALRPGEVLGTYDTWTRYKTIGIEVNYSF